MYLYHTQSPDPWYVVGIIVIAAIAKFYYDIIV